MASFNFYVEKNYKNVASNQRPKSLFLKITEHGRKAIKIGTPLKIEPDRWNARRQQARGWRGAMEFNNHVGDLLSKVRNAYMMHSSGSVDALKDALRAALYGDDKPAAKSFIEVYDDFMSEQAATKARRTVAKYQTLKFNLQKYQEQTGHTLTFEKIDLEFCSRFRGRLIADGKYDDTISKYVSNLKTFMQWAADRRLHDNFDFKKFDASRAATNEIVTLTRDELDILQNHEPEKPHLQRVKDVFLFLVFTGQRISDVMTFEKKQVWGEYWTFEPEKTRRKKKLITIPLKGFAAPALDILKKYDYNLPLISEQKFNDYLKDLAADAGLTRLVTIRRFSGARETTITRPLCEWISSHMARRTCISILANDEGVPLTVIQKLTGHSSIKTLMKYVNTDVSDLERYLSGISR